MGKLDPVRIKICRENTIRLRTSVWNRPGFSRRSSEQTVQPGKGHKTRACRRGRTGGRGASLVLGDENRSRPELSLHPGQDGQHGEQRPRQALGEDTETASPQHAGGRVTRCGRSDASS